MGYSYGNRHALPPGYRYGTTDKAKAEAKAEELQKQYPANKYEVAIHDHASRGLFSRQPQRPVTWGVLRFIPYCEKMPFRCDGFVQAF